MHNRDEQNSHTVSYLRSVRGPMKNPKERFRLPYLVRFGIDPCGPKDSRPCAMIPIVSGALRRTM